ncbi:MULTISPECIES: methenyltetrahydrofolate cyclohydrolase [Methylobacterium]|uniref:Formiminotetrahydrofolate cyclodeaminase n=2 Tax=Methylobacterium TaxID=407 RepID=A0AAE8L569_9HYPH|nr:MULTISPECIES: methenyltetrahydrofolate cyclohydrolase [Methylobacterium]AIQ91946.1 Formiminotransferase-cyclodeaminase [Methylobacterium oryzae CBMB20]APT32440.1 methenyltetrahydrofolate cyclohydrolase [Methylobacterium phyllosphaerae]MDE4911775.1 cyclodeaminase/cyclohydrolase family protein [Methylobacterium sp. 092160098-2]RUP13930.1 MAG: methenyltetrahydrofolate cyclohydrolase [Methylobacterium sp.]WFS05903.1 cyclodeaminase/cyclohydrolase family protein [Methylobacterium sp. 391_Methyba4
MSDTQQAPENASIQTFLTELASAAPTPGGGGAAAISGAMGAALVSMVCNLTIGKKKYVEVEAELKEVLAKSEGLRVVLTGMIGEDVQAFDAVMGAYGLPKATDDEKAARAEKIQAALKTACDVPLACCRACRAVIDLAAITADKGNLNVVSDAGVAVLSAYAGLRSAALNVYVNAKGLEDRDFADERLKELEDLLAGAGALTEKVYEVVKTKVN